MNLAEAQRDICISWDNSNIFVSAKDVARDREGPIVARDMRIHFDALYELARAGRRVVSGICVGSLPPGMDALWTRLRDTGIELEMFERGQDSGTEQAVDQALQVHLLKAGYDMAPGVIVLLTGDCAGAYRDRGYFADLQRLYRFDWDIEVLSWRNSCHVGLRTWAEEHVHFVALDDYYDSITFIEGVRTPRRLARQSRPFPPRTVE